MNVELLKKALDAITNEPHRWDQNSWVDTSKEPCGTTLCLAGHVLLASEQFVLGTNVKVTNSYDPWTRSLVTNTTKETDFWSVTEEDFLNNIWRKSEYEHEYAAQSRAAKFLEINDSTAITLFHTLSGKPVRNPDAFRCFVVQRLLFSEEINSDEAIELLDITTAGPDPEDRFNETKEPPF